MTYKEAAAAILIGHYRHFDEAGQLPPDLKRGVLPQDGVYDLLKRHGYRQTINFRYNAYVVPYVCSLLSDLYKVLRSK